MKILLEYIRMLVEETTTRPKAIFMAGGPAAGKSTVIQAMNLKNRLKVINPDDEYELGLKAAGIPLDRSDLFKQYVVLKKRYLLAKEANDLRTVSQLESEYLRLHDILSRGMKIFATARKGAQDAKETLTRESQNFLVDGTGGNYNEINSYVKKLREVGYDVAMIYIDVPIEISLERNQKRGDEGGRRLEDDVIIRSWNAVNKNMDSFRQVFGSNFFYIDAEEDHFRQSTMNAKSQVEQFLSE
jgi:predicted ABC-type ATPase